MAFNTNSAAVMPQNTNGAVQSQDAVPYMAGGGAIPDDVTGEDSPNTDVVDYTNAMAVVRKALDFGRQQHGLPASRPQQAQDTQEADSAIPDEEEQGDGESYAEGGMIEDEDVAAHEAAFPDESPEQMSPGEPDIVRPPISADNNSAPQVGDEQTAIPAQPETPLPQGDTGQTIQGGLPQGDNGAIGTEPKPYDRSGGLLSSGQPPGAAPHEMLRNGVQGVISYLQRSSAMPAPEAKALEASNAKPDKNETTLATIASIGDEQKQFDYLQYKAKRYEFSLAHAYAATTGTRERPPSIDSALASANEAFTDLPDATDVRFRKGETGTIEAYTRPLDSGSTVKAEKFTLSPDQFKELTKPNGAGQWDKAIAAGGITGVLKQLAPNAAARSATADAAGAAGREQNEVHVLGGSGGDRSYKNGIETTPTAQSNALERIRARNEGRGGKGKDYDAEGTLEDKKHVHKMEQLKLQDTGKTTRSTASIDSRVKIAADKLMEQAKSREAANGRNAASNAERLMASKMIATGGKLDPDDMAMYNQMRAAGTPATQQQPTQQGAPRQIPPQYQAAAEWAKANPSDPRAAKIRKLIGAE